MQTLWCNSRKVTRLLLSRIAGAPSNSRNALKQLVRMDDIAFAVVFVRIDDPVLATACDGAEIAPGPPGFAEIVSRTVRHNGYLSFH